MKKSLHAIIFVLAGMFLSLGSLVLQAQTDDPNIDRIPDDFIQHQQNNNNRNPSSVITIDGYDNYYLGIDFAEGHISENPQQPGQYFTAWNIDDIHYTNDGHEWSDGNVSWGGYNIRGDVLTAYDADGNLYYENMYGSSIQGCVVVTSTDNGASWSTPVVAISGNDKNWMTADQTSGPYSNNVYTVMTNSGSGNFARSTDQGTSFQNTATFSTQALPGMMVCVGAWGATDGGAVYVVTNSGGSFNSTYTFYQSLNGGQSFTQMSAQSWSGYVGTDVNGRNSVQNMRTRPYPFITADNSNGPNRGRLYTVYASNAPAGNGNKPDIFSRYSDDGGSTWSTAITVNDDFPSSGNNQWHPATWCDYETGRLYVQWMDTRDTPTADSALIYATYSDDGGETFVINHAVSNQKMKINCNTCGGGGTPRYQGDYNGIISNPITSMPAWADFRNGSFKTFTAYFPDYAMGITPAVGQTTGGTASFDAEIPSVKAWTEDVTFDVTVETPSSGSFNIDYPSGNTLSSFPGTLPIEVSVVDNVPPGMYELILTGTGPNGTPIHIRTATVEVIPTAPPVADFEADVTSICLGNMVDFTDLTTGGPTSWLWSFPGGTPSTSTDQNPSGIVYDTPGMFDVTLEATNSAGTNTITKTDYIEVLTGPAAPMSDDEMACFGSMIPDLSATGTDIKWYDDAALTNLVFSGTPFATGQTDPGMYTYYVTQSASGCESAATMVTLTIYDLPVVTLNAFDPICVDAPPLTLSGGTPDGGDYSGTGVSAGMFDPDVAGVGMHDITYTYTDGNGCINTAMQSITVNDLPTVTFDPIADVCLNAAAFNLTGGMPVGGEYTGAGVSAGIFDPTTAGAGMHDITYTYFDANGCINSAMQSITVNELPVVTFDPMADVCLNGAAFSLTGGMPAGGEYEGIGVSGGMFYPEVAGIGIHEIMYTYMDANGCENSAAQDVAVKAPIEPNAGPDQEVCADNNITLNATTTDIVSYEWYPGGLTTPEITVDSAGIGIGSQMFIVMTTDINGCTSSDSVTVTFKDCTGIGELAGVNNIVLYPNPGQGSVSLQIDTKNPLDLNIRVYNNRGISVYEENGLRLMNSEIVRMDLSDQAAGIYLVMVYNNQGKWVEKLVIRK